MESILSTLQENVCLMRKVLDHVEALMIPYLIIHIELHFATPAGSASSKSPNLATHAPLDASSFDLAGEQCLLQGMVDE
jgi:hypothetical protein